MLVILDGAGDLSYHRLVNDSIRVRCLSYFGLNFDI
jgi:hypothetical protein